MKSPEFLKGPFHLARIAGQLGVMAVKELVWTMDQALDCFGPDDPEDAEIHSDRWLSPSRHDEQEAS